MRTRNGFAMMLVLIAVAIAVVMGISYVSSASVKMTSARNLLKSNRARYLAESGIQHALYVLRTNPSLLSGTDPNHPLGPYQVESGMEGYVFWATPDDTHPGYFIVTASATCGGVSQRTSLTALCFNAYKEVVLRNDPMGYWRLGDTTGSTITDETGQYNGTYHNVKLGQQGALNDSDTAAYFDGWGDWANVPSHDFQLKQDLTVVAWVKFKAFPLFSLLGDAFVASGDFGEGRRNNTLFQVGVKKGGDITYKHECLWGLNQQKTFDTNLSLNTWYQVTVVRDSATKTVSLYINGSPSGTYTYTRDPEYGTDGELYFGIGTAPGLFSCTHGTIDDVAIFDKTLPQTTVQEMYTSASEGERFEVVGWNE
jgi:hypothetical protein